MDGKMKLIWIIGVNVACICGWIGYMAADNQPPYDYFVTESYVVPSPSLAGHQVTVHWKLKVNRICPGFIIRTIVDAKTMARVSYDPAPAFGMVRTDDDHLDRTFFLPEGMRPGPKIYRANAEYVCNLLQRIWPLKVQTPDLHFEVGSNG